MVKQLYSEIPTKSNGNIFATAFLRQLPKNMTSVTSIRAVSYDENVKLRTCKAVALLDNNESVDISYTVQSDEKKSGKFYVELNHDFIQGLMMSSMFNNVVGDH